MRLYVGNLSFETGEEDLQEAFGQLGTVESVHLVRDQFSGRSRGFAFVEMPNDDQARAACEKFNEKEFQGRKLTVNEARPQARRGGPGGGPGGGGPGGGGRQKRREPRW
jgi:RNA recognition motif-containing protein